MSWIRKFVDRYILSRSFDASFDSLLESHGHEVIRRFNLSDSKKSYWIECSDDYPKATEMVDAEKELYGSPEVQINCVMKQWKFFPTSAHQEVKSLLRYVLYLRKSSVYSSEYPAQDQYKVRDNVYEM